MTNQELRRLSDPSPEVWEEMLRAEADKLDRRDRLWWVLKWIALPIVIGAVLGILVGVMG